MPVLFGTVIEGIRHLISQITGLAAGTRVERIPLSGGFSHRAPPSCSAAG